MGGRAGAWRGPTAGHGAPGALGTRGAEDGFFPPPCEDTLPFLQPCEGSRDQLSICVSNPLAVAFQLMHECCRASVPPGSGEMLPLPSCLPSLAHTLGQVEAWPSLIAGPSFTSPLSVALHSSWSCGWCLCTVLYNSGPYTCPWLLGVVQGQSSAPSGRSLPCWL